MALNSLFCADVPLSNYSLTHAREEQRTRNWPHCTDNHQNAHQNDCLHLWSQKVEGHDKKFFRRFSPDVCPTPTFKFVSAPLKNTVKITHSMSILLYHKSP